MITSHLKKYLTSTMENKLKGNIKKKTFRESGGTGKPLENKLKGMSVIVDSL